MSLRRGSSPSPPGLGSVPGGGRGPSSAPPVRAEAVVFVDLSEFTERYQVKLEKTRFGAGIAVFRASKFLEDKMKEFAPKRTGELASTIRAVQTADTTAAVYVGKSNKPYHAVQIIGQRRDVIIVPRRRKVLRFMANGDVVFTQAAHLKAWSRRPTFVERGINEMRRNLPRIARETLKEAIE